ncbi:MAG: transglutaminase-like domain-containing protein [Bacillota bacterium]|nr:transglutaminase-like domain-containing protein [Bacillota bacterium]
MLKFNAITILIIIIFLLPLVWGIYKPFTRERIFGSLTSMVENTLLLAGIILSVYLVKMIYFDHSYGIFSSLYGAIPQKIKDAFFGKDILVYFVNVPVILLLYLGIMRFITIPLYRYAVYPFSNWASRKISSLGKTGRNILGVLSQIPKSIFIVFLFAILLNFFSYYFSSPLLSKWMNESTAYQTIYRNAIYPVLNSNIAKKIPVLFNDSFKRTAQNTTDGSDGLKPSNSGNAWVIKYFNGVTLDEAIKSNDEIDATALKITQNATDDREKALLIYKWISRHISYDEEKAVQVSTAAEGTASGSIVAFDTRKGICFDYSCLYVSMCRAVGLKVRLITGLAYSGVAWGDHAWNQVYYPADKRWINVDSTFGVSANYFDKNDFNVDHKYAEIQGQW